MGRRRWRQRPISGSLSWNSRHGCTAAGFRLMILPGKECQGPRRIHHPLGNRSLRRGGRPCLRRDPGGSRKGGDGHWLDGHADCGSGRGTRRPPGYEQHQRVRAGLRPGCFGLDGLAVAVPLPPNPPPRRRWIRPGFFIIDVNSDSAQEASFLSINHFPTPAFLLALTFIR